MCRGILAGRLRRLPRRYRGRQTKKKLAIRANVPAGVPAEPDILEEYVDECKRGLQE